MTEQSPSRAFLEGSIENVCLDDSAQTICVENCLESVSTENSIENVYFDEEDSEMIVCLEQSSECKSGAVENTSKSIRSYRSLWEKEEEFEGWLTQGSSADKAYCKWCKREFRAHKSTLIAHASSESHKRVATTTGLPESEMTVVNSTKVNGSSLSTSHSSLPSESHTSATVPSSAPTTTPRKSTLARLNYLPFSSKKGQIIGSGQKRLIINLYTYKLKVKKVPKYQIPEEIHVETGLGLRSVKEIIKEYHVTGTVKSPTRKRPNCRNCFEKLNSTQVELMRSKIQKYFGLKEVPTINQMLEDVNADPDLPTFKKTSFHRVLHHLGYEWVRRGRNRLLVEQKELKAWKEKYLENFLEYRTDGLDETWLNVSDALEKSESE